MMLYQEKEKKGIKKNVHRFGRYMFIQLLLFKHVNRTLNHQTNACAFVLHRIYILRQILVNFNLHLGN